MKRILVTGSRDWPDTQEGWDTIYRAIRNEVSKADGEAIVVHGNARGADQTARKVAQWIGIPDERHPYFAELGRRGGPARNAHMVSLGADVCLAFIKDNSRGASHCAALAEGAGIEVVRYTA